MNGKQNKKVTKGKRSQKRREKMESPEIPQRENSSIDSTDAYKSKPNDWRWYAQNQQLLTDAATYAYGTAVGSRLNYGTYGDEFNNTSIPGIMRVNVVPTVGWSDDPNSAVNISSRNLYTYINAANSRNNKYDSADLMIYLICMDSAYSFLSWMRRLYGIMTLSNIENRYFPWAAVRACGGDYFNLIRHYNDLRGYINMFATRLGSICIPNHMSIMAKHEWMYSGIYLDYAGNKAQSYCFSPIGFHKFELDSDGAGFANFLPLAGEKSNPNKNPELTYEEICSYGDDMLNRILHQEGEQDFNMISADILKAYGEAGVHRASAIPETYSIMPSYDATVMDQIQNATIYGVPGLDSISVYQDATKNHLLSRPRVYWPSNKPKNDAFKWKMITIDRENPTPADTMEATRLCVLPGLEESNDGSTIYLNMEGCGSEIAANYCIYYFGKATESSAMDCLVMGPLTNYFTIYAGIDAAHVNWDPDTANTIFVDSDLAKEIELRTNDMRTYIDYIAYLSKFDRHPQVYTAMLTSQLKTDGSHSSTQYTTYPQMAIGDVSNYIILADNDLKKMSEVALLSEFGIENYGRAR